MILSIGIAGLGYVINDLIDYKDDLINNKQNLFLKLSRVQSSVLVLIFISFSIFPWFFLPFTKLTLSLIVLEFFLFFIYAMPPFRLKEKGFIGIVCDSMYARVLPCFLAIYTYSLIVNLEIFSHYLMFIFLIWLLIVGIRNIISHQILDFDNDANSNTITFVTQMGVLKSEKLLKVFLFPLEFILFLFLVYAIPETLNLIFVAYIFFVIFILFTNRKSLKFNYIKLIDNRIFNEFYEIYLPNIILIIYSFINPLFIWLLLFNWILFSPVFFNFIMLFKAKYF